MHETEKIYDGAFTPCFNAIKQYRDQWNYMLENREGRVYGDISGYTDIWGPDVQQYAFIQEQTKVLIRKALRQIVCSLLSEYGYTVEYIDIKEYLVRLYSQQAVGTSKSSTISENILAFVHTQNDGKRVLYIFRDFGLQSRVSEEFSSRLRTVIDYSDFRQISWVNKNAFIEIVNHNNDVNDPGRGTNTYSFDCFVRTFFGQTELNRFAKKYNSFKERALNYCGIALVKTLRPNVLFSYRSTLRETIRTFDFDTAIAKFSSHVLSKERRDIINSQFIGEQYMSALASSLDYAKCFMTAEWLFSALEDSAETIDLTPISMGYFKALEQFMYAFIGMHTSEKDNKRREISFNNENWIHFTDGVYKKQKNSITLGNMAKFLRNRDNRDLLRPEMDDSTFEIVRDVLTKATGLRNGCFHKDNMDNWTEIVVARDLAFTLFYFFLGAYSFSTEEKTTLGICCFKQHDDCDKLFAYVNHQLFNHDMLTLPIFYLEDANDVEDYWFPCFDADITYDELGEPQYSGLYLRRMREKEASLSFTKANVPKALSEGSLIINRYNPTDWKATGPLKLIFSEGKFVLE